MEITELIKALQESMDSEYIQTNDSKIIDLLNMAADKLEELQRLVDDMLGDHYIDYLEFYANRCRELEYSYCELCTQYALSMDGTTPNCSYCDLNNKNIMH